MSEKTVQVEPPQNAGHQLAAERHSARSYAKSVVRRWPPMTQQERAEVAQILAPIVNELADLAESKAA